MFFIVFLLLSTCSRILVTLLVPMSMTKCVYIAQISCFCSIRKLTYIWLLPQFFFQLHPREIPRYLLSFPVLSFISLGGDVIVGIYVHIDPLKLIMRCTSSCKMKAFCCLSFLFRNVIKLAKLNFVSSVYFLLTATNS